MSARPSLTSELRFVAQGSIGHESDDPGGRRMGSHQSGVNTIHSLEVLLRIVVQHLQRRITPAAAQRSALERARRSAIETVLCGEERVRVLMDGSTDLRGFLRAFIVLNQDNVYGQIADEEEPVWKPVGKIQAHPGEQILYSLENGTRAVLIGVVVVHEVVGSKVQGFRIECGIKKKAYCQKNSP